jgi:uncharacterized membrane protein
MSEFVHSPIVVAALAGFISAASVDFTAFKKWQSWQEGLQYNWSLATWRWVQGVIIGAVTGAGFGVVIG